MANGVVGNAIVVDLEWRTQFPDKSRILRGVVGVDMRPDEKSRRPLRNQVKQLDGIDHVIEDTAREADVERLVAGTEKPSYLATQKRTPIESEQSSDTRHFKNAFLFASTPTTLSAPACCAI